MALNLTCPRCGAPMVKATAYNGAPSEFWYKCSRAPQCNTYYNSFKPMSHQHAVLIDNHKLIGNFGGFGSAKTYTTRQLVYKQLFISQKATVLIGANVSSQYKQTIQREIEADIPKEFVKKYSVIDQYMELFNGSRLLYRPLDDVDKLRSMNLSAFFIIEGSEVDPEAWTQLKTRLRNMAASKNCGRDSFGRTVFKWFRGKGVVESNPDAGWIREDVLTKADVITQHGTSNSHYDASHENKDISVHISSSDANTFLPDGYIDTVCAGKPSWWVERYIYGSFEFANGLVCPKYKDAIVPSFEVPKDWVKLVGHDPGLVDASAFINIAVDDKQGIAYVYRDHQYHDMGVEELYKRWQTEVAWDIAPTAWYTRPVMDGKMHGRRMFTDKQTLDQMWAQYDVYFQPGHINVLDRVWRINTYLESGRLKIMDCCENLIREFKDYKWVVPKSGDTLKEKPVDKNNHSIDAMGFALMKLPEKPQNLMCGAYTGFGTLIGSRGPTTPQNPMWMFTDNSDADDDYGASAFEMEV